MNIVPIQLGCCREATRCRLCGPPPPPPDAARVRAWIEAIAAERGSVDRVSFFGGAPPTDAMLDAVDGLPVRVRVRPDLLSRDEAARLARRGVEAIELDALTFHTPALRAIQRRYPGPMVRTMAEGLAQLGLQVGVVLAVGLPGHSHEGSVEDARIAAECVDTARLHPVLILRDAGLWEAHLDGRYTPLTLAQAVTTCRAMLEHLEGCGVRVIRVGQQPGPDEIGRAVAGPRHSAMRELIEARRTLDRLRELAREHIPARALTIRCAAADETRTRGPFNDNVRTLRAELGLRDVFVEADPTLERGSFILEAS